MVMTKEDVEDHMKRRKSDPERHFICGVPWLCSPTTCPEVKDVVKRVRSASAPGPNGIPYKLYKRCPQVLKVL